LSYYDNVKDNIRTKNKEKKEENGDTVTGNFDSLKEAAEQNDNNDEEEGDDTPIEVLEEDGLSTEAPKKREKKQNSQKNNERGIDQDKQETSDRNPLKEKSRSENSSQSNEAEVDLSGLEEKMDKMIEQNDELIRILRSFTE